MKETTQEDKLIQNKILSMILPITAENILQMTAGVVSMAMVGRINSIAVGAIGISSILFRIIWSLFKGLATGTSVFVAQSYGADNQRRLMSVSEQAFILSLGLAIIFQQLLFWNSATLLKIFNPSAELLAGGIMYLKIISWSLPFAAIILLVGGIMQGVGNAKSPMIVIGLLNIINILFCYLLIFGNFGFPALGLKGAAYAYNIAYMVSAIFGLSILFKKDGILSHPSEKLSWKFKFNEAILLLKFGLPTSFESSFWQFASIILTRAILTYGETAYAAYQLGLQAEAISYMPAAGFGITASTFIGQALGSRNPELGRKYLKHLTKLTIIITLFASVLLIVFPNFIMRALTDDLEVIKVGALYLFVMGLVQIPQNLSGLLNGALRGAGYPKVPMINAGVGLWLIRIPLVLLSTYILDGPLSWVWIIMGIDLVCRFILALITFKKKAIFEDNKVNIFVENY